MDSQHVSTEEADRNYIEMINGVLNNCEPGSQDAVYYQDVLADIYQNIVNRQHGESSAMGSNPTPPYVDLTPSASSSRKRSLGIADAPEPKRISTNASPLTPSTPDSMYDAQWSVPSHTNQGYAFGFSASTPFVDLTIEESPSADPFPELVNAFRVDGVRPAPADAFNQDFMATDELVQFLINPTPAGGGYGFQQQQVAQVPKQMSAEPFDSPSREVPHLRGFGDSEGEYDEISLSTKEAEAIDKMLENIQHHDDETPEDRTPTPHIMQSTLKEYQKIGLKWLLKMESGRVKGGILADEMGLGKTVQAIALIAARPSQDPLCKTTLVIAPVALMRQWEKEIQHHIQPRYRLRVYLYWGKGKKADFSVLRNYDVVLTTFGTLTSEFKQKESRRETMLYEREINEPGFRRKPHEKLALLGRECMWYRIIIDEAHTIKNRNAISSKASVDLQARHRLCMTGTPMMNSVDELYPLLRFLRVDRYNDWEMFKIDIGKPVKHSHPETRKKAIQRVQILIKTVMLRRQKTTEIDGKPIINLPPKHITVDNVEFSDDEMAVYKALETKSQLKLNKYLDKNSVSANYASILVLVLRLRQACCHPQLIKDLSQPATEGIAEDDLLERARHLSDDVVERLKDFDSFECPICLEADPNPTIIIPCGHTVCGECVQKLLDPSRPSNEAGDNTGVRCPHCRGDLKARFITDFKHFLRVHVPERLNPEERVAVEDVNSDSDDEDDTDEDMAEGGDDVDASGNLAGFVVDDDEDINAAFESEHDGVETAQRPVKKVKAAKDKGKGKARAQPKKTLAQLKKESQKSQAAKKKYLRRLEKTWKPSAKIMKTVELLKEIRDNDPNEKTLIFSQFTSLLDLLEVPLQRERLTYQRFDGSMSMDDRASAVDTFMEQARENILMISLKAGNAGLNLSKASRVIILDPFWNPFVEDQAVDRAHRMPQEREVTVHRILVPETVEDRICALQDKKREVVGQALDEKASKSLTRLSVRDLRFLFGMA